MKTSTSEEKHGIKCTTRNQLDLDFTYDLALLSRAHEQMQTTNVSEAFASLGISIHKSKVRSSNTTQRTSTQLHLMETMEHAEKFTYLGSITDEL
ncbi:unnamed protein product [Schistosoma margrebowiei]|uniref:Uncharacterized protein n=1 Tax=Schistosoma margrebowiei TaxID=48269 RepID=A0A183MPL5_9TREM|nr:unnamed protein product [Schistosoma margrebowiei]